MCSFAYYSITYVGSKDTYRYNKNVLTHIIQLQLMLLWNKPDTFSYL